MYGTWGWVEPGELPKADQGNLEKEDRAWLTLRERRAGNRSGNIGLKKNVPSVNLEGPSLKIMN